MTTLYPGAQWRPLASQQPSKMSAHNLIILHTMVGSLWGTDSYFAQNGYGGTESHFGVGHDGEILQWVDLECRADANLDANDDAISIETADLGDGFPDWSGSNVPAWTADQIEAIAQIVAWCCARWSIPCVLVPDSKPGRRGIGYHRQGIDPWRVDGGEEWSTSEGKVCPGDRRVGQVDDVIRRANEILSGDDDMTPEQVEASVRKVLNEGTANGQTNWAGTCKSQLSVPQGIVNQLNATQVPARQIAVLDDPSRATYSVSAMSVQHVPDPQWQDVLRRTGLLPSTNAIATTINNVQMEWVMRTVLEAGGEIGCPAKCGKCLLETRWRDWSYPTSRSRYAIDVPLLAYAIALILHALAPSPVTADGWASAALATVGGLGLLARLAWQSFDRTMRRSFAAGVAYVLVALAGLVALVGYIARTDDSTPGAWAFALLLVAGIIGAAAALRPSRRRRRIADRIEPDDEDVVTERAA